MTKGNDRLIEEWRPVIGFKGFYEVSSFGRVRSVKRRLKKLFPWGYGFVTYMGVILKWNRSRRYLTVMLARGGVSSTKTIHSLVAAAFIGPRPRWHHVCHRDGKKINCSADNLYYGTPKQNSEDSIKHGVQPRGETCGKSKLTDQQVRKIRKLSSSLSQRAIAARFDVSQPNIGCILRNETWRHLS